MKKSIPVILALMCLLFSALAVRQIRARHLAHKAGLDAVVAVSLPSEMPAGSVVLGSFEVKNCGASNWVSGNDICLGIFARPVRQLCRTSDPEFRFIAGKPYRIPVEKSGVIARRYWHGDFQIQAPKTPGIYTLHFRMVREWYAWFGRGDAVRIKVIQNKVPAKSAGTDMAKTVFCDKIILMSVISIKNLVKYFGSVKAVDDISLKVEQGEIFGFLGPNGAGKTTTIRCMTDFIRPTSGEVKLLGKEVKANIVDLKKSVSYLPANMQFNGHWSGADHISLVEKLRGGTSKTKSYIEELDFNPSIKVHALSTGNKQKLGLILALIGEPKLLILDEPTAGLDPILQNQIYKILNGLIKNGSTVFMSSHYLHEVEENCNRVAIIKKGKIVATETISSLKHKKIYTATVSFADKINEKDFALKGVLLQQKSDGLATFNIKGDINPLLNMLAKHKVDSLEIMQAPLEEVFLEYYED